LPFGWPIELMYPSPSQGEEGRICSLLKTTATAATTQVTGATATHGGGLVVLSGGSGNVETGIEVGDIVRVRDGSDVLKDFATVTEVDTGAHTITVALATITNIGNGSVDNKVFRGRRMKPGTTKTYTALEVASLDLPVYRRIRDWIPTSWSWGFRHGQNGIQGAWDGLGTAYATPQGSAFSSSLVTETTTPIFTPKVSTTVLRYGVVDLRVMEMSAAMNHPAQAAKIATSLEADDVVPGRINGGGSFRIYQTGSIYDAIVLAGSSAQLLIVFVASTGAAMSIAWPATKLTNLQVQAEGPMVTEPITWQSELETTQDTSVRVTTYAA